MKKLSSTSNVDAGQDIYSFMAGLATRAKKAGVAGVENDFTERVMFMRDDTNSHCPCGEIIDAVA